eukprot:CAMPEP_0172438744 /NCGR_PEP_ID=MMETSP1064-20121228/72962_1 /TAXON_ID=202472 /ORGANISM="Aulacoseira subarctica , Strain CCAP 1002/5" /LENGTH=56 /DNA_ID=CAMNT_0013187321 /DNA_START=200 /DNA_END=370 /DNA_ORIENTATION=+
MEPLDLNGPEQLAPLRSQSKGNAAAVTAPPVCSTNGHLATGGIDPDWIRHRMVGSL